MWEQTIQEAAVKFPLFLQGAVVREFFAIARNPQMDRRLPGFRAQQWYFFLVSTFYLYGR